MLRSKVESPAEEKCETKSLSVSEVIEHMVTIQVVLKTKRQKDKTTKKSIYHLQPTSQDEISGKLSSCVSVLKGDLESIKRVGREILSHSIFF